MLMNADTLMLGGLLMNTQEIHLKLNEVKEIELKPITERVSDFVDTLLQRYAEAVDQVKRRLGLKPRSRREVIGDWMNQHRWVPIAVGAGLITTIVLVTRSRFREW